jgi:hypothetical protein
LTPFLDPFSLLDAIPPILARYPRVVQLGAEDLERFAVEEDVFLADRQVSGEPGEEAHKRNPKQHLKGSP